MPIPTVLSDINWGDVPSWVTAIGSVSALIFATAAVFFARRTYALESGRDQINADARNAQEAFVRRSQAALVSVWWDCAGEGSDDAPGWGAWVRNASEAPVYKAYITAHPTIRGAYSSAVQLSVVPPAPDAVFHRILDTDPESIHGGHAPADWSVSLRFTDAAGIRWFRDEHGVLSQLGSSLVIWTSPETEAVLAPFKAEFLATYGVTATVDTTRIEAKLEERFLEGTTVPDILVGPQDWLGNLVRHGAIEPLTLSEECRSALAEPSWCLPALTVGAQTYGIPSSLDTIALFRNVDLAPESPVSFDELLATGEHLRDQGTVPEVLALPVGPGGDPFQVWPLLSSAGGWVFGRRADGSWDPTVLGVDTPETVAAFEKLGMLGKRGVLRPDMDVPRALEAFERGNTAFLVTTSGAVTRARKAGVNFEVTPVPPFTGGKPATPLVAVYAFYVARNGNNRLVAHDLAPDYLSRDDVVESFGRLGNVIPRYLSPQTDPAIDVFHSLCLTGVPMPSFPAMRGVWKLLGAAEVALLTGRDAAAVASQLARDLAALFA